jgi:hypothetical protein
LSQGPAVPLLYEYEYASEYVRVWPCLASFEDYAIRPSLPPRPLLRHVMPYLLVHAECIHAHLLSFRISKSDASTRRPESEVLYSDTSARAYCPSHPDSTSSYMRTMSHHALPAPTIFRSDLVPPGRLRKVYYPLPALDSGPSSLSPPLLSSLLL